MRHDHAADHARAHAEAALVRVPQRPSLVQKLRPERAREIVAQIVTRSCLQAPC